MKLKKEGSSNRQKSKMLPIDRKTVVKCWDEYVKQQDLLSIAAPSDVVALQENICTPPAYNVENRTCRKYSKGLDAYINEILDNEYEKCKLQGLKSNIHSTSNLW